MRIIKFRGKRVDNGEWVYGDFLKQINQLSKCPAIVHNREGYILPNTTKVKEETVEQYTGLSDKNGKEI